LVVSNDVNKPFSFYDLNGTKLSNKHLAVFSDDELTDAKNERAKYIALSALITPMVGLGMAMQQTQLINNIIFNHDQNYLNITSKNPAYAAEQIILIVDVNTGVEQFFTGLSIKLLGDLKWQN